MSAWVSVSYRRRLVGPALVGATPEASAVTGAGCKRRPRMRHDGTIPAHLTCRYMECLGYGSEPGIRHIDGGTVSTRDDVEEFAALLRELKSRTDRSYGVAEQKAANRSTGAKPCGTASPAQ